MVANSHVLAIKAKTSRPVPKGVAITQGHRKLSEYPFNGTGLGVLGEGGGGGGGGVGGGGGGAEKAPSRHFA